MHTRIWVHWLIPTDTDQHLSNTGTINNTVSPPIASPTYSVIQSSCNGSCGTTAGDSYTIKLDFKIVSGVASLTATTTQGVNTLTSIISSLPSYNPSLGIDLILTRDDTYEIYQLDKLTLADDSTICQTPIPTMSHWALFILGLSLTSMAVVTIRKRVLAVS